MYPVWDRTTPAFLPPSVLTFGYLLSSNKNWRTSLKYQGWIRQYQYEYIYRCIFSIFCFPTWDFGWTMAIKVRNLVELWLLKFRFWPLGQKTILYCKVQTHKCKNTQVSLLWVIHENFHPHNRSCFLHVPLLKSRFWPLGHKTILYCKVAYPLKNPGNLFVYLQFNLPKLFTRIYYVYIIIMFHVMMWYLRYILWFSCNYTAYHGRL
jgi:hypothetical protein